MGLVRGIGYVAAFCTTFSFALQAVKVWRTRSGADVSTGMYGLCVFGLLLWVVYGALLGDWPIILANIVTATFAASVLAMKWRYSR